MNVAEILKNNNVVLPDMTSMDALGNGVLGANGINVQKREPMLKLEPINQKDVATTTKIEFGVPDGANVPIMGNPYGEVKSIEDIYNVLKPIYKEETPEEKAQREKREQAKIGFTGLMDGLNALSNLYYTTKGAPSQQLKGSLPAVVGNIREQEAIRRAQKQANAKAQFDLDKAKADIEAQRVTNSMKWDAGRLDAERDNLYKRQTAILQAKIKEGERLTDHEYKMLEMLTQHGYNTKRDAANNAARMALSQYEQGEQNKRANAVRSGNMDSIALTDKNGKTKNFRYDKANNGALLSVYKLIQDEIAKRNKGKDVGDLSRIPNLEDFKIQMGEGGDIDSKVLTIIKRRAKEFPELTEQIERLLGGGTSEVPSPSLLPSGNNNKKQSLLPN